MITEAYTGWIGSTGNSAIEKHLPNSLKIRSKTSKNRNFNYQCRYIKNYHRWPWDKAAGNVALGRQFSAEKAPYQAACTEVISISLYHKLSNKMFGQAQWWLHKFPKGCSRITLILLAFLTSRIYIPFYTVVRIVLLENIKST